MHLSNIICISAAAFCIASPSEHITSMSVYPLFVICVTYLACIVPCFACLMQCLYGCTAPCALRTFANVDGSCGDRSTCSIHHCLQQERMHVLQCCCQVSSMHRPVTGSMTGMNNPIRLSKCTSSSSYTAKNSCDVWSILDVACIDQHEV